jgi:ABC-2 type transport system ATP-binding protein
MIRIESLTKVYGQVRALDGLSLHVEPGVVYGFLGPNGAGKTTTLRILSGLARPTDGQAMINGKEIGAPGVDVRAMIGVLPEEPAFYPWMTAREYLCDFIAPLYGVSPAEARQRTKELLETVGLAEAGKRRLHGFSRGMRQRMGLAAALVHRPAVLLLDEPVSALDPAGRKEVLDLIESLRGQCTILLSTHILADVERVCDVVGIIAKGRLIVQEECEALLARYAAPLFEIEIDSEWGSWPEQVRQLSFVKDVAIHNHSARILVSNVQAAQSGLLTTLSNAGMLVQRFEIVQPSLEDAFLQLTELEA